MPTLVTNIQERVRKEQVRTVKYKLTKATDKMNSLGKIEAYPTTMDFVNELKKHMSIAKVCKSNELDKCWPSDEIKAYSGSGTTLTAYSPKDLTTGQSLKALALSTKDTQTVGIVTGDGVPMLLVYSPVCSGFDEAKTYTWSVEDGKPVTNATTNCISAIFDINGTKGQNKVGQDVRTLNSLFGSTDLGVPEPVGVNICNKMKAKYGFKYCNGEFTIANNDRWVGGIYECDKLGLHLPERSTLAMMAASRYGDITIGIDTMIYNDLSVCAQSYNGDVRCYTDTSTKPSSAIGAIYTGTYWANSEGNQYVAWNRDFWANGTRTGTGRKDYDQFLALCVGD